VNGLEKSNINKDDYWHKYRKSAGQK